MSELQEIGEQVSAVSKNMASHAQSLYAIAQRLRQSASQVAASGRNTPDGGREAGHTATALNTAAEHCARAAEMMLSGKQAADRFVSQHVGAWRSTGHQDGDGGSPGSTSSRIASVASWLPNVNPGYDGGPNPRSTNCGECAAAVYNRLNGRDINAVAGERTLSSIEMAAATGRPQVRMTPSEIRERIIAQGPGSCAVVGIDRADAYGHWFNAYYDGADVFAIDGQSGEIGRWPPNYGTTSHPVIDWDCNV